MKKVIFASFAVIFSLYAVFGSSALLISAHAEGGDSGSGDSVENSTGAGVQVQIQNSQNENRGDDNVQSQASSSGDNQEIELETGDNEVKSTSSLEASINSRENELDAEVSSTENSDMQEALKDNNGTRLAVHALLSSKPLLGGIGPEVSALAQDLNSSVTSTIDLETKIQSRGFFARLFFGGDQKDAVDLLNQVDKNQKAIDQLTQVIANCASCSTDVKVMLQNQLTVAQDAQVHLTALAQDAQKSRGILGTILSLFGK